MNAYFKACLIWIAVAVLWLSSFSSVCHASPSISTALGSTYEAPQSEIDLDCSVAQMIASYSSMAGYTAHNQYGSQTDPDNIYSAADGYWSDAIAFYIGHGGSEYVWNWVFPIWFYEQQWLILDNDGCRVYDEDIFGYTGDRDLNFVLLWSCFQGDVIGGTHWSGYAYGMPNAWLHTTSLSNDGYGNPDDGGYTFGGFNGSAPFLTYDGLGAPDAGYHFIQHFYYAALYRGHYYSINDALDYAAQIVWGTDFGDCILHTGYTLDHDGKMSLYGDGNMHISEHTGGEAGGCPLLYVYDGEGYSYESLLDIHNPEDVDVVTSHALVTTPTPVDNTYVLRLIEHPLTHSSIDQVKMLAILEDGRVVRLPLISAVHDEYDNILSKLVSSDDVKVEAAANHVMTLRFRALPTRQRVAGFVFLIEGNNPTSKT